MPDKTEQQRAGGGQATAPAEYPNQPCYSNLLWLGVHEIRSGYSDESRHTTGTSGADFAWKPPHPRTVTLPAEWYHEGQTQ